MAKYYVQTETLRLVLDAATVRDAAVRAIQWCHDRHAEIYRQPADDRIRDAEALEWHVGRPITVSEVGFDGGDARLDESTRGRHWIVLHPARQIKLRGTKDEVNRVRHPHKRKNFPVGSQDSLLEPFEHPGFLQVAPCI
jgi:hypothetical protein